MPAWDGTNEALTQFARKQLFFVGGAPRSGTTWLQQMLDAHPDVCCRGEGLFLNHLAVPLERLMEARGKIIEGKNRDIFGHTSGYPRHSAADCEFLVGSAILQAMLRQTEGRPCRAVGEKTPENVFFYPRLRALFPAAKFIAIVRDPRDVLASAWHFFAKKASNDDASKTAFVKNALPSIADGARAMLAFGDAHREDFALVTYEAMLQAPALHLAHLFRMIGVDDDADLVAGCVARTSFKAMSGRSAGETADGSFFRKGVSGDWRHSFSQSLADRIVADLRWLFERFGWPV